MALLRYNIITKMSDKEKQEKLKELKMELVKAGVTAHRTNAKTREIKRAIARIYTSIKLSKSANGGAETKK